MIYLHLKIKVGDYYFCFSFTFVFSFTLRLTMPKNMFTFNMDDKMIEELSINNVGDITRIVQERRGGKKFGGKKGQKIKNNSESSNKPKSKPKPKSNSGGGKIFFNKSDSESPASDNSNIFTIV